MNHNNLFTQLNTNTIILTPNRRLSTHLRKAYARHQQKQGEAAWETPRIIPFSTWLTVIWQQYSLRAEHEIPILLNEHQCFFIWEKIITDSLREQPLVDNNKTSQLAIRAWHLSQQWQIDLTLCDKTNNHEVNLFCHWAATYQQIIENKKWIDQHQLANLLTSLIQDQLIPLPEKIILAAFDEITPQQKMILQILTDQGVTVEPFEKTITVADKNRYSFPSTEDEIKMMAHWAKQLWQEGERKIACVVPNLQTIRHDVVRIFKHTFSNTDIPSNISGGEALNQFPIIHTALAILSLNKKTIGLYELSQLIRSPFLIAAESEMNQRAQLDTHLRELGEFELDLVDVIRMAEKTQLCPILCTQLQALNFDSNSEKTLENCLDYFTNSLNTLGWPGERTLNSEEYQVVQRWYECFNEFRSLGLTYTELTPTEALQKLKQITHTTLFQAQSQDNAIQVLGTLEAAGLTFDHLWIMGMDDENWPPAANPNPFLPIQLQRQIGLPHASPEKELQFCRELTERFTRSAKHIVFSHAEFCEARVLTVSPLIQDIPASEFNGKLPSSIEESLFASSDLESYYDHQAPALTDNDKIRGGSAITKLQAACPFRAFAELRLRAQGLAEPYLGLDAIDRGLVLHRALELVWRELNDHETLCSYDDESLTTVIQQSSKKALRPLIAERPKALTYALQNIEIQRLSSIIKRWLALEKTRPPFTVVEQESEYTVNLHGIELKLRIDRIDELKDGEKIIIDYKTGLTRIKDWFNERPNEPQLPLYGISNAEIAGLMFAQVRADTMLFRGIATDDFEIPGLVPIEKCRDDNAAETWEQQLKTWRSVLTNLISDFQAGIAVVDPKEPGITCAYCELPSLCRVYQ